MRSCFRFILLATLLAGLTAPVNAADRPRLALWLTKEAINNNACRSTEPFEPTELPDTPPTLTEQDIVGWDKRTAYLTLDQARYPRDQAMSRLTEHCFILAIDGKRVSSGVVLLSYSARLIRFPVLQVNNLGDQLKLQLTSCLCSGSRPIHVQALDAVLGNRHEDDAR